MTKISIKDIAVDDSRYPMLSLLKLTGKQVKDIRGYLTTEFYDVTFQVTQIVFEDDSLLDVDGEHDIAYVTTYPSHPQPHMDAETLKRLYDEAHDND